MQVSCSFNVYKISSEITFVIQKMAPFSSNSQEFPFVIADRSHKLKLKQAQPKHGASSHGLLKYCETV